MWMIAWAAATPLDIDAVTLERATAACTSRDPAACEQLVEVAARAWTDSVWGQAYGTDTIDGRRWRGHAAYLDAACEAGSVASCWVVDADFGRACTHDAQYCPGGEPRKVRPPPIACLEEGRETCPEAGTLAVTDRPGPGAFPVEGGWLGFGNGRLYPRTVRDGLLVDGGDRSAAFGDGFVFLSGPFLERDRARPVSLAFLSPEAPHWSPVVLDLEGKGLCYITTVDGDSVVVNVSDKGRCGWSKDYRRVFPDGRVEAVEAGISFAGAWVLRLDEAGQLIRQERGGEPEVVPFGERMRWGAISASGHVATQSVVDGQQGWHVWDGKTVSHVPVGGGKHFRWADEHLFVFHSDFVVRIPADGSDFDVWALPEPLEHVRVHPDGRSFWGKEYYGREQVFTIGEPNEPAQPPEWVRDVPPARLEWKVGEAEDPPVLTVLLEDQPLEGAFLMGQYTGADGKVVATHRMYPGSLSRRCVARVDGVCRYGILDVDGGQIDIAPVLMSRVPDGRSRWIRSLGGPVVVGLDYGDAELGFVTRGEGRFVTRGAGEANHATDTHRKHNPPIEPVYTGVISDGEVVWTPWPKEPLRVVDEAGLPLAGLSVSTRGDLSDRAKTDLDGRVELRNASTVELTGSMWAVDTERTGADEVRLTRPVRAQPVPRGEGVDSLADLYGRWRDVLPQEERPELPRVWTFTPAQAGPFDPVARTALLAPPKRYSDGRTLVVHDIDHLVGGQPWHRSRPVPRAFERVPRPKVKNNGRWFTGVFGWSPGDEVERSIQVGKRAVTVDVGQVSVGQAGLAVDWELTKLGTAPVMQGRHVDLHEDGWFVGLGDQDFDQLEAQLYEVGAGYGAFILGRDAKARETWPRTVGDDWMLLVEVLVDRRLERDVTVRELHLDAEDEEVLLEMTYRGRVPCDLGKCGRVEIRLGEGKETVDVDLVVEPNSLRPVRREVVDGSRTTVETWVWR